MNTLGQINYPHSLQGDYGDSVAPRYGGPSAKYTYLQRGKKFLAEVAKLVQRDRPSFTATVRSNAAGPGSPGEASIDGKIGQITVYVTTACHDGASTQIMWRYGSRPYAVDGANCWTASHSTTPRDIADQIIRALRE